LDVRLDSVPIRAACPSKDRRVFLLTHLPSFEISCDNEPMDVIVMD